MWRWFQSTYDKIDSWEMSPKWRDACKKINAMLPEVVAKALLSYIQSQYKKSEEIAEISIGNLKKALDDIL
jgi:hypothetical protein